MLYIMRHGKTDWNLTHKLQGKTDIPLNEMGIKMAKEAGERYKDIHFDVCYCSPLVRARDTAKYVLEGRDVPVIIGVGEVKDNPKDLESAMRDMGIIAGQKPVATTATKSIAAFKLREGMKIGCKVTLRGDNMYYFLDKLVSLALPRVRDFRGINPNSFDGHGNYAMGIKEQLMFPEIDYDKIDKIRGMDIIIVTTAGTDEEAFELLKLLGMPFRK